MDVRDAHLGHLHLELGLDRLLDLDLVGVSVHLEGDDVPVVPELRRLLGDQGAADDLLNSHIASTSTSRESALSLTTRYDRSTTSYTLTASASTVFKDFSFREARARFWFSKVSTRRALPSIPRPANRLTSSRVLWLPISSESITRIFCSEAFCDRADFKAF